jgi:hypothetical protein
VKPKHSSNFKRDDSEEDDEVEELLQNELLQSFDTATWGMEPQSPWSQYAEQNTLVVPTTTEQVVIPNLYTPQGVGLYFFILLLTYFCIVTYKAKGQLPILWKDVEKSMLTGMLPSEVYKQLG